MPNGVSSRIMTRTTIDLDASVLEQLRKRAAIEHKSMGQLASERLAVGLREQTATPAPANWPTKRMGKPKIDLGDKEAVRKTLE
jgi:Arc/MetJ family transcription regulator